MIGAYGSPDEGPLDDVYMFHTLRPDTFSIGPFTVTADRVEHPVETYGVRIEHDGKVLAYSADTAPCDALVRLAAGADAFLCEASYLASDDNPPGLHMTGRDAGEAATKAGAAGCCSLIWCRPGATRPPPSTRPDRHSTARSTWSGPGHRYDI